MLCTCRAESGSDQTILGIGVMKDVQETLNAAEPQGDGMASIAVSAWCAPDRQTNSERRSDESQIVFTDPFHRSESPNSTLPETSPGPDAKSADSAPVPKPVPPLQDMLPAAKPLEGAAEESAPPAKPAQPLADLTPASPAKPVESALQQKPVPELQNMILRPTPASQTRDAEGRLQSETTYHPGSDRPATRTEFQNGIEQRRTSFHTDGTLASETQFDVNGRRTSEVEFDSSGALRSQRQFHDNSQNAIASEMQYTPDGNVQRQLEYHGNGRRSTDTEYESGAAIRSHSYDLDGALQQEQRDFGPGGARRVTEIRNGQVVSETAVEYDQRGRRTREVQHNADGVRLSGTTLEPETGRRQQTEHYSPDGRVTHTDHYRYQNGEPQGMTRRFPVDHHRGPNTSEEWDANGRLVSTSFRNGSVCRVLDARDQTTTTNYEPVHGATGTERVLSTHGDVQGRLDRVETRDGRVFQRTGSEWSVSRNGQTENVRDVQVAPNGDLTYRPANDSNRTIRETQDGRYFVTGADNVPREYVNASNYEAQPRPADSRLGMLGNLEAVPAPEGHAGPTRYEPVGGQVRNGTDHPILVMGNGRDGDHGSMRLYVIQPGSENNPRLSDVDAVVTDSRFQPIVSSSGATLIPNSVPPDARAVKIRDTGSLSATGGYSNLDVSGGWIMRSSGTVGSLNLSGGQPVSPEPRAGR